MGILGTATKFPTEVSDREILHKGARLPTISLFRSSPLFLPIWAAHCLEACDYMQNTLWSSIILWKVHSSKSIQPLIIRTLLNFSIGAVIAVRKPEGVPQGMQ